MWKWLHRGVVGVLVTACIALTVAHYTPNLKLNWNVPKYYRPKKLYPIGFHIRNDSIVCYVSKRTNYLWTLCILSRDTRNDHYRFKLFTFICHDSGVGENLLTARKYHVRELRFKYWQAAILTAIYPALFFIRSYRRRRVRRQALQPCSQCGYDLQGNESGVCPECGEAVEVAA